MIKFFVISKSALFFILTSKSPVPKWHRDEIILALDLYFRDDRGSIDKSNDKIIELSTVLNKLPLFPDRPDAEKFRNPNGVTLKLSNFLALDGNYGGKGMQSYSKLDSEVFTEFAQDRMRLKAIANEIRIFCRGGRGWLPR